MLIKPLDNVTLCGMSRASDLMAEFGIADRGVTVGCCVDIALQIVDSLPRDEFLKTV